MRLLAIAVVILCACGGGGGDGGGGDGGAVGDGGGDQGPVRQVRAGRHHSCVLMRDGRIYCWGQGAYRALGGDYNGQTMPRLVEAFDDAESLSAGRRFGCAVRPGGEVWCWGEDDHGQAGPAETIPCGDCAPLPDCADSVCVPEPEAWPALDGGIVELSLGGDHGCALRDDRRVLCWGDNSSGQVGQVDLSADVTSPTVVDGVEGARQVTSGDGHTCALIDSPGQVLCWGKNERAQVGNGEVSDAVPVPAAVAGLSDAVEVTAGGSHTCARRQGGAVVCWGYNYLGALGNGDTRPTRATSIEDVVGIDDAVALAAGDYFTCALREGGELACWGDNGSGQLGNGTTEGADCDGRSCRTSPVPVMNVTGAVAIDAGDLHACAADRDGRVWCWGYNLGGQVGTGEAGEPIPTPAEVDGLPG